MLPRWCSIRKPDFEIWKIEIFRNLKFLKSEIWNFWNLKNELFWNLKSENFDENFEKFRSNFFLKTNFSNRSEDKWPAGDGDTFIFSVISGQSNWGRSFSEISDFWPNLSHIVHNYYSIIPKSYMISYLEVPSSLLFLDFQWHFQCFGLIFGKSAQ